MTGRVSRRIGVGPTFVLGSLLYSVPFLLVPLGSSVLLLIPSPAPRLLELPEPVE